MSEENQNKHIHDLKVNELRAELEKRSLDKSGVKATLIERLEKALRNEGHDVSTFIFNDDVANKSSINTNSTASTENVISNITDESGDVEVPNTESSNGASDSAVIATKDAATERPADEPAPIVAVGAADSSNQPSTETSAAVISKPAAVPAPTTVTTEAPSTNATAEPIEISDDSIGTNETQNENTPVKQTKTPILPPSTKPADNDGTTMSIKKEQISPVKLTAKSNDNDLASSVWIRGISNSTKAADLKTLFSKHGKVLAAKIFTTKNKLAPTCFGYITMADADAANLCIQKLNRTNLKGKVITVEKAERSFPQISKAGRTTMGVKPTTTTITTTTKSKDTNSDMTPADKEKPAEASNTATTGGESPEIIYEDVRTKGDNNKAESSKSDQQTSSDKSDKSKNSTEKKKTERPRIVVNNDSTSSSSRKVRPPTDSSTKTNATTRTARNISRRVITTSNARYRANPAHTFSRVQPGTSSTVRRFSTTRPINSGVRYSSTGARLGYRPKPVPNAGPRFSVRGSVRGASGSYGRSQSSFHHAASNRHTLDSRDSKISSWERNELLLTMRQREDEYRKKEEELKLQRERERLKFERERLEREKLEIQQLKLTAQLANAQMALIPNPNADYNDSGVGGSFGKSTKSSSKKHSNGGSGDSRRDPRHHDVDRRHSKSRGSDRPSHSRSRSPHHRSQSSTLKRGSSTRSSGMSRYVEPSKSRYEISASSYPSAVKHSNSSGYGQSSHRGTSSSRDKGRGLMSSSTSRFGYGNADSGYARNYDHHSSTGGSGVSAGRNPSPVRRGTTSSRSSGGNRDSYLNAGTHMQRFMDEDLRVSQYIARTDPSYASRVTGSAVGGGGTSSMGVSADEMFGLTGSAGGAGYYSSGSARLSSDNFRDSLPSTYQTTLNSGGSNLQWGASGTSRSNYLDVNLDSSSNWVSGYANEGIGASGRSDWDSTYGSAVGGGSQHYASRYNAGATSGYASRRY